MSLAAALERAAEALAADADAIRPANGDPDRLLRDLEPAAAVRLLDWLLCEAQDAGEELVEAWLETPEGAERVMALEGEGLPKAGRKVLRRARHRLRSRGVAVRDPAPAPVVARLGAAEAPLEAAKVTRVDPSGALLAAIAVPHPAGGARLFHLVLDPGRGVLECEVFQSSRGHVRRYLRDLTTRRDFPGVDAPLPAVRALCARVADLQAGDRPPPAAFREWQGSLLGDAGEATPGELAARALGVPEEREALERVARRVRDRTLGPWPPPPAQLREEAARLQEIGESQVIVSPDARKQRAAAVLDEAGERCFDEAGAEAAALRLEHSAYVAWRQGAEDEARGCLAAAAAFRRDGPRDNPVARALLEVALAPALAEIGEEKETSLLVKP